MKRMIVLFGLVVLSVAQSGPVDARQGGLPAAVADNADRIAAAEQAIADLQGGLPAAAGVLVRVDGEVVGSFLKHGFPPVVVDAFDVGTGLPAGRERVTQDAAMGTTNALILVSSTGYIFGISTTDFNEPQFGSEGTLNSLPQLFQTPDCTGQAYFPVEGETGSFSTFEPGMADNLTTKRWFARQGFAFHSVDRASGEAFMVRRNQPVMDVPLNSVLFFSAAISGPFCADFSLTPIGNQINSVVLVEPLDSDETGITADMVGPITVGF